MPAGECGNQTARMTLSTVKVVYEDWKAHGVKYPIQFPVQFPHSFV